jgi:hypothetical protein
VVNLEAGKPKEASGAVTWLNPRPVVGLRPAWVSLEGRPRSFGIWEKPQRGAAFERTYGVG